MQPVLITLNEIKSFHLNSFFHVIDDPSRPIINQEDSDKNFRKILKTLYIPTLEFLRDNNIKASLLATGNFLERSNKFNKYVLELIRDLIDKDLVTIIAGPFYGENLSCAYNFNWWLDSVNRTKSLLEELINYKPKRIYLPELYRKLPIEKIVEKTGIHKFILPTTKDQVKFSRLNISDIRKDSHGVLPWIKKDRQCEFTFIPEYLNFAINGTIFRSLDLEQSVKTCFMAIGFQSNEASLRNKTKPRATQIKRINERPSLTRYNSLQKSAINIWEYVSVKSMGVINTNPNSDFWFNLYEQLAAIQNEDFLMYYMDDNYLEGNKLNFNSPYEAFAFMQAISHQVEILIEHSV